MSEVRSKKQEARSKKPEVRSQKPEDGHLSAGAFLLASDNRQQALLSSCF
jgi:hypothetical protein